MIRKGEEWGSPVTLTGDEPIARDDREVAALLGGAHPPPLVVLRGGDLFHSLGGRAADEPYALPVDLLEVTVAGSVHLAAAHVQARGRGGAGALWRGDDAVAMNATHLGQWNLGPKAHPNDGLADVTRGRLSWTDRRRAQRRAVTGSHVPHPALHTRRVPHDEWQFDRPHHVIVDGVDVAVATEVHVRVLPDRGAVVLA